MRRFPEDAKEGEPQALIPESDQEWLGIETDIPGVRMIKIFAAAISISAAATFGLITYWQGWWP